MSPLLELPDEQVATELRRTSESEAAERAWSRQHRRVFWQCVFLGSLGVPIYAYSWHLTEPRQVEVAVTASYFATYVLPWLRWLVFHVRRADG